MKQYRILKKNDLYYPQYSYKIWPWWIHITEAIHGYCGEPLNRISRLESEQEAINYILLLDSKAIISYLLIDKQNR